MDIERVRACDSTEDYEDGRWMERGLQGDLCAQENLSQPSELLKHHIELFLESAKEPLDEESENPETQRN